MNENAKGNWVTYRPDIRVLDCTIRDGGLVNTHHFKDGFVKGVYDTLVMAGVDYMELGYKASGRLFSRDDFGMWKFCTEDDIRKVIEDNPSEMKLTVMADAERCDYKTDILPAKDSILDCIRVACYIHQLPVAIDMIKDAADKGYETTLNLMAVSVVQDRELRDGLDALAKTDVNTIYLVDSYGSLYTEQIRDMTASYLDAVKGTGKTIGFHGHNNQMLAYANTIESLIAGASMLDSTLGGMGRGAGNCPTELLVGFLKNPKYRQRPLLECVQNSINPLLKEMEWGYSIPYMLTGQLNQHPREAIKMRSSDNPDDYVGFYDQLMQEDS